MVKSLTQYAFHLYSHKQPLLWRLHRVHHCDVHLDVSSALRTQLLGTPDDPDVQDELRVQLNARTAAGIIGSSVAFESVVLSLAAWIFCRRDF